MERFVEFIKRLCARAEEGQDFVEYAMLIVLCVVFVIVLCCIGVSALKDAPPIDYSSE